MLLLAAGTSAAALAVANRDAHACGGCFSPPDQITTVNSHRMVISLGLEETVLWDQILYSGDPEDFIWVLPVPTPEVTIELAESLFFEELDTVTAPSVQPISPPPRTFCPVDDTQSIGCGGMADSAADGPWGASDAGVGDVTIYDRDVVGPYETVVIGSEDPTALYAWLDQNNYAIAPETLPAIEHYVTAQNAFVVLRLRPGQGIQAMQPVRVRYPGMMATFPLKMVVVGAQGVLDLSLWVFAEQRYEARTYGTLTINTDELAWDWAESRSNYRDVFDATVERGGNRAWVVEYADAFDNLFMNWYTDTDIVRTANVYPYLTRLRTRILVDHIDRDLDLSPAADTSFVSNVLFAPNDLNRPPDVDCGDADDDGGIYCTVDTSNGKGAAVLAGLIVLGVMLVFRRRRQA